MLFFWTSSLSYIIIGLNICLREICIWLINLIGYPTETRRLANITRLTFYAIFLNTGFLPLMINANL